MNVTWKIAFVLPTVWIVFCAITDALPATKTLEEKQRSRNELVDSINRLSWNLMTKMSAAQPNSNLLLSPISISSVLLMLWIGASGKTKNELEKVCGFQQDSLKNFYGMQSSAIRSNTHAKDNTTMIVSNAIFFDQLIKMKSKFLADAKEYFNADVTAVDFKEKPNEAKATINEWVKNRTLGEIEEVISGELERNTVLVITNAVYFRGKWQFPFKTVATSDASFKLSNGKSVIVPMMRKQGRFAYKKACRLPMPKSSYRVCSVTAQPDVVEIPYENGKHIMILLIPNSFYSLKRIEEEFSEKYRSWRSAVVRGDLVQLSMPKFHVDFESSLVSLLQRSGVKTAFTETADFSDMTKASVKVSQFLHKASIKVDEGGTTAAAASAAIVVLKTMDVENIIADRSFYFTIEDVETGVHLFEGKIEDPTQQTTVLN